jgi:hypothetical protein
MTNAALMPTSGMNPWSLVLRHWTFFGHWSLVIGPLLLGLAFTSPAVAAEDPDTVRILARYKPNIDKGLAWLAKQQARDGHWEANNGWYPVAITAMAGMALLAEGSTPSHGKYAKEVDRAVDFILSRVQKTGLIGNPTNPRERERYMYGHGFGMMFLAQVYGEEGDEQRRKELERVLTRAVEFMGKAQTKLGGWGYVTAADGNDFDEGSVTVTQLQALRACKNAGIPVPKEIIDKAQEYLKKSTQVTKNDTDPKLEEAGVVYSLQRASGNVRPPLAPAGIACMFNTGEYKSELAVKWLNYCQRHISIDGSTREGGQHFEYTHYYYAQVLYILGEDRHAQLRPDLADAEKRGEKALLKWSRYRETMFEVIASKQLGDGSWPQGAGFSSVGPVYSTAIYLTILQLDKGNLPIYQR